MKREERHLAALRRAEATVAEMEEQAEGMQRAGRGAVGVVGRFELGPMADALYASGLGWYPLLALSALGGVDALFLIGLTNASGSVSLSLGIPNLTLLAYVRLVGMFVAGLFALRIIDGTTPRSHVARGGAALAVASLLAASVTRNAWALAAAALLAALASGWAQTTHRPLLFDHYRPEVRVRALAAYAAGIMLAAAAASAVTPLADAWGVTWRAVFLILAAIAAIVLLATARLRDAVEAGWETRVIAGLVHRRLGPAGPHTTDTAEVDVTLTAAPRLRQVVTTPAAVPLLVAASAFGLFLVSMPPYLLAFWRDHWRMTADAEAGLYAGLCVASVAGLAWFARRGELAFRASPAGMLRLASRAGCLGALCLPLAAIVGSFPVMVLLFAVVFGSLAVLLPAASVALLSIVRPAKPPHAAHAHGRAVGEGG
ncbi:MAG: MFS transporter, partial [Acidimicrobiales bacterium]